MQQIKTGIYYPISYSINDTDFVDTVIHVKLEVLREDILCIEIYRKFIGGRSEFWFFKIANIENSGQLITGKFVNSSLETPENYIDFFTKGNIRIIQEEDIMMIQMIVENINYIDINFSMVLKEM